MRDNFFHTFFQLITGYAGDQVGLPLALRVFTVAFYWCALLGGLAVAIAAWRNDLAQRTGRNLALFLIRFTMGGLWYLGSLWKLPLPVSGGFMFWMGASAKYNQFDWHASFMQLFLDHIAIVGPLIYLLELSLTVSMMLGLFVRFFGVVAAAFTFNLLLSLYNDPTEWPWTYMGIIFTSLLLAMDQAGVSLGLDRLLSRFLATSDLVRARVPFGLRWLLPAPGR